MAIVGDELPGQPQRPAQGPAQGDRSLRKSPAAFRTIAEVAGELELPAHVLRFWESKFPQVKPLKRRGGRRYYRPEDVDLLRHIRTLLYTDGYTIRGVQRLLKETGSRPLPGQETGGRGALDPGDREAGADRGEADPEPGGPGQEEPGQGEIDLDPPGPADAADPGDDSEGFADPGVAEQALVDLLDELEAIRALLRRHGF